jgi:hypothetical protein
MQYCAYPRLYNQFELEVLNEKERRLAVLKLQTVTMYTATKALEGEIAYMKSTLGTAVTHSENRS